ncbi:hypothetical protein DUNSADRAFT_11795 [Dunaliella salina]|uniref:Uncharacterized protein n=1 Tax=Dunaliella salina TaxID=3046 RepID=A0ABQ7GCM1_DUNSA|nr:hypothetical protein DUNSADRAFT_11795 [Dunaliella salina]|eukprot:KAF5832319.1 hypothetical protein DUNSADRAFT_11795 [Dunaliella salina]
MVEGTSDSDVDNDHVSSEHHNDTAYMQVSRTGVHTLQATSTSISLAGLRGLSRGQASKWTTDKCWDDSCSLLSQQGKLKLLPEVFEKHLFLREYPSARARQGHVLADVLPLLGPKGIIKKVEGACLAGRLPWMSDEQAPVIQQIRANNNFFRRPWFDCVEVQRIAANGREERAYAELRLLFEAEVSYAGLPHAPTPYAFIRWFRLALIRGDPGCVRVVYEAPARGADGVYEVIHLSSIVCRHHVVQNVMAKCTVYVSTFSPVRPV